jgi:hypothetical protein
MFATATSPRLTPCMQAPPPLLRDMMELANTRYISPLKQPSKPHIIYSEHPRGVTINDMRMFLRSVCC